ncbi:hypothetical protein BDZ91DRAFT_743121 [Kalaharituber pfeilii]|nr:hypothetical protein BDZ91DRAFT_743121 [Kalaharituber pfeilii]
MLPRYWCRHRPRLRRLSAAFPLSSFLFCFFFLSLSFLSLPFVYLFSFITPARHSVVPSVGLDNDFSFPIAGGRIGEEDGDGDLVSFAGGNLFDLFLDSSTFFALWSCLRSFFGLSTFAVVFFRFYYRYCAFCIRSRIGIPILHPDPYHPLCLFSSFTSCYHHLPPWITCHA